MTTPRYVIPTHRRFNRWALGSGITAMLIACLLVAYMLGAHADGAPDDATRQAALAVLQDQRDQGRAEGFANAVEEIAPTVASAYSQGYLKGQSTSCPGSTL